MTKDFTDFLKRLDNDGIQYWLLYDEDEDENEMVGVPWCEVGPNFYDYEEDEPKLEVTMNEYITESPYVELVTCANCCGCAGW